MKRLLSLIFVICFIGLLSPYTQAQDLELTSKEKQHYNSHPEQILPAARTAFSNGDYLQTQKLCRWHFIVVGDENAERIRLDIAAKECASMLADIISLRNDEKIKEAKGKAQQLLKINPNDTIANETMLLEDPPAEPEPKTEPQPLPESEPDSTSEEKVETTVEEPANSVTESEMIPSNKTDDSSESLIEQPLPAEEIDSIMHPVDSSDIMETIEPRARISKKYNTRFALSVGAMACNLNDGFNFGPEVTMGVYDIAGSHMGLELGGFYPFVERQTIGIDALMVMRIVRNFYVKVGGGAFICDSDAASGSTKGLCPAAGLSYTLFNHLTLNANVKYMPEVIIYQQYEYYINYLAKNSVISAGLCPSFSIGWLF